MSLIKIYLTQAELAQRWLCSVSSIVNYRKKGQLPYFQLPESTRILYKINDIENIEQLNRNEKRGCGHKKLKQQKKEKPVVSANSNQNWRI